MPEQNKIRSNHSEDYICAICKNIVPIPRPINKRRKWHRKTLWCIICKKETTHRKAD